MPELEAILVDRSARLRLGSVGRGVALVQQALLDLGERLATFGADGKFGRETERAVRSYQTTRKAMDPSVATDGVVGKVTISLLDSDIDAFDSAHEDPVLERRDVWVLSHEDPWHPTIEWYAWAVAAMQARDGTDFADPTCWRHLADAHGTDIPRREWPAGALWRECEHSTWFFLPWHRIYLHHFEKVVRETIVSLGGPADWTLPYWSYSDLDRPETRRLPPAFRQEMMRDGSRNALFVTERAPGMNADGSLDSLATDTLDAFAEALFSEPAGTDQIAGFGGPATARNHRGGPVGSLENVPHGTVHMGVGGVGQPLGFMSSFETAGRDPIFWLHHANIDRLWEGWLRTPGTGGNPSEERWRNQSFHLGAGAMTTSLRVRDVLDPTAPPLRYRYSDMPLVRPKSLADPKTRGRAVTPEPPLKAAEEIMGPPAELVGATEVPVPLTQESTAAELSITAPTGPIGGGEAEKDATFQPERIFLKLENVRGTQVSAGSYLVHLNPPDDADPAELAARRVGQVAMFGVVESTASDEEHSGSGLTFSFDITETVRRLGEAGEWDPEHLRVTFTPVPDSAGELYRGDVEVGRVSLYYG